MDISGSAEKLSLGDDEGMVVPIGFDFEFYGDTKTEVGVSSNGYLTFGDDLDNHRFDVGLPDPATPNDLIAPLWADLHPARGGTVTYATMGDAGTQTFTTQYMNVPDLNQIDNCQDCVSNTFQVIFYEETNCFEYVYQQCTALDVATIGFENMDGTEGMMIDNADAEITPPATDSCIAICPPQPTPPPTPAPTMPPTDAPTMHPTSSCDVCAIEFIDCYSACK